LAYEPFRDKEDGLEFKLALNGEVLDSEVVLPVVGQALVEGGVVLSADIGGIASPDGLGLVKLFVGRLLLFDLLSLLLLGLVFLIFDFLNLRLVFAIFSSFLLVILDVLE
jgi:hypothetical protein